LELWIEGWFVTPQRPLLIDDVGEFNRAKRAQNVAREHLYQIRYFTPQDLLPLQNVYVSRAHFIVRIIYPAEESKGRESNILLQPTPATQTRFTARNTQYAIRNTQYATRNTQSQIVEIHIPHVRHLREIRVQVGDIVTVGQVLVQLEGYAEELNWEVGLIELELAQARAKLAQARAEADAAREEAAATHAQQVTAAEARVTALERRVATLQRQQQIATARLAQARATTAYRQRWLDTLEPLQDFDPWGDLPYLVGSQNGPQGPRSDLAYREALAKAEYDLRLAKLAQQVAELEAADATARLEEARADLEAARAALAHLQATPQPPSRPSQHRPGFAEGPSSQLAIYQSSVRINELRLARARAELEQTVVKSLVTGKVLDVRIERVDGNEATVLIRIAANFSR
jgi:multidrug efflux pump subunit AcrA (membrane-fusion protein)